MAKYRVWVTETLSVHYPVEVIEAETEDEAQEIAEEMRAQGALGDPHSYESVDDVDYDVKPLSED